MSETLGVVGYWLATLVVVCPGVGANRANFFAIAEVAASLGCHALAFDFRAHGESGGWVSTFGAREVLDVVAAVDWLRADPQFASAPLVLAGVPMGAATVLRAAKEVRAAGALAESSFADLATMLDAQLARLGPVAPLATAAIASRGGRTTRVRGPGGAALAMVEHARPWLA